MRLALRSRRGGGADAAGARGVSLRELDRPGEKRQAGEGPGRAAARRIVVSDGRGRGAGAAGLGRVGHGKDGAVGRGDGAARARRRRWRLRGAGPAGSGGYGSRPSGVAGWNAGWAVGGGGGGAAASWARRWSLSLGPGWAGLGRQATRAGH